MRINDTLCLLLLLKMCPRIEMLLKKVGLQERKTLMVEEISLIFHALQYCNINSSSTRNS